MKSVPSFTRFVGAGLLWMLASAFFPNPAHAQPAEPEGYRMRTYRAPVPLTLKGATVLDDKSAHTLWKTASATFIDVLPRPPKPKNLPEGTVWRDRPHRSIPGAVWLINVGYGALTDETIAYFKAGLEEATGGDRAKDLVFFCLANCWMSWNAAKRALELGYSNVAWFPGGTDDWTANSWPTQPVEPYQAP